MTYSWEKYKVSKIYNRNIKIAVQFKTEREIYSFPDDGKTA